MMQRDGFLGCDVSKGYADFVMLGPDLQPLDAVAQFDDTRDGHDGLRAWIGELSTRHGLARVNCGLESTGGLEDNWYGMLGGLGEAVRVARLNPSVVKDAAKAELNDTVTDARSARNIAMYLVRYAERVDYAPKSTAYAAFRGVNNHIAMLNKQKTMVTNEFKQLLYRCFPEVLRYCRRGFPAWSLRLLAGYPSAGVLSRSDPAEVAGIKGVTIGKAESLVALARRSVASRLTASDEFLIPMMARDILHKEEQLDALKGHLEAACKGPEVELLATIVGVGRYSAAVVMAEIEDIARFPSPDKLCAFFGVHPSNRESGDKKAPTRMSKKGRPAIRAALYNCARTAVVYDPHMKALYVKHRARGKGYDQALGVVMHKMLRVVWGMLATAKPYDAEIDKANQLKKPHTPEDQERKQEMAKRRMQKHDPTAPISGKAMRKRKALEASQPGDAEVVRDLVRAPAV